LKEAHHRIPPNPVPMLGWCVRGKTDCVPRAVGAWGLGVLLLGLSHGAAGQQAAPAGGASIYACVDVKGRRITSDRPIPECLDREQRELSATTGITRRVVPASLTAEEREHLEAKAQQEAAQRTKANEDRRRDRALLSRYPNPAKHHEERAKQLAQIDAVIASIQLRSQDLTKQRAELALEMEFYKSNPSQAPASLKRRLDDNAQQQDGQKRLEANQSQEKQRINVRFDEELARLRQLWPH
jgi:hypothetical protein